MDRAAFAKLLKSKYPQYATIADEELVKTVLEKHPEYQSQIDPPVNAANETAAIASRGAFGAVGQDESGQPVDAKGQVISREPTTKAGGFAKHITDSLAHNPGIQGAAEPQSLGDMLPLMLMTGNPMAGAASTAKRYTGAVKDAVTETPNTARGWMSVPGKAAAKLTDTFRKDAMGYDQYLPNRASGQPLGPLNDITRMPDGPVVDRYMPNTSGATPGAPVPNSRIPYGAAREPLPPMRPDHIGNTIDDTLTQMLYEAKQRSLSGGNELPPTGDITPGAALHQSGKFPKSGRLGQAGGYTSGRPAVTPTRYDEMLSKLGGSQPADVGATGTASAPDAGVAPSAVGAARASLPSATDRLRSIEPVDEHWHSGAEPGSPEARSAQSLHLSDAELNQRYKQHTGRDSLLKMILAGLTGGSAVGASAPGSQQ